MFLLQLIILQVLIFGGLIFALRTILTKNISSATSHLDTLSSEFARREEDIKKRQAETEKYYEETVARAKNDADKIRQETDAQIQAERERILEEARLQSEQIVLKAEKTKEMIANELREEIEAQNISRVRRLLLEVFPKEMQERVHELWVEDLLNGDLGQLAHMRVPSDVQEAKVVTAFALEPKEREAFKKKFKEQLGREFTFKEEVDPSLVAGVVITVGSLVLDGSVINKIEEAVKRHA